MPHPDNQVHELLAENQRLKAELAELQKQSERLHQGGGGGGEMGMARSIVGLDERILQLDENCLVEYMNAPMAKMLGVDRREVRGCSLADFDRAAWGSGVLMRQIEEARKAGGEREIEKTFADPTDGKEKIVLIKTSVAAGKPQIIIEDVTQTRLMEGTFKRMVSAEIMERVMEMGKDYGHAERYELTVLFADLRGFTSMSQNLPPEGVRETVNEFLSTATDVIINHGGTVDKYVGDEVMALFGAPYYYEDHAIKALNAAIDMQIAHAKLNQQWQTQGRPVVGMGVGINTGEMVVGLVGSELRTDFTVLGHNVNLAARLCGLAASGDIWLGPRSFDLIKQHVKKHGPASGIKVNVKFKPAGSIRAKGIDQPVDIVNVVLKDFERSTQP